MTERNVEIVRALHEVFREVGMEKIRDALSESRDLPEAAAVIGRLGEFVLEFVDPEIEIVLVASALSLPDMPAGTRLQGFDGWLAFWRGWLEPWENFDYSVAFEDQGDDVVVDLSIQAQGRGSGAPVDVTLSQIWTLRDEKIVGLRIFNTRAEAVSAAGTKA